MTFAHIFAYSSKSIYCRVPHLVMLGHIFEYLETHSLVWCLKLSLTVQWKVTHTLTFVILVWWLINKWTSPLLFPQLIFKTHVYNHTKWSSAQKVISSMVSSNRGHLLPAETVSILCEILLVCQVQYNWSSFSSMDFQAGPILQIGIQVMMCLCQIHQVWLRNAEWTRNFLS